MYNKEYRDYLNVLRAREARPPFKQMARLVATAPPRGAYTIPLFAKFAGALALSGIIVAGYWALSARFHGAQMQPRNKPTNTSLLSHVTHGSYATHVKESAIRTGGLQKIASFAEPEAPVPSLPKGMPLAACAVPGQAIPFPSVAADTRPIPPIAISSSDNKSRNKFFVAMGGELSQQFSSNASYRRTSFSDAFLGVGYDLSQNSSVRILAGEEAFNTPSNTTTNSISFHDTTFVHDGQSYQNVIGEIQSTNIAVLTRVYCLGASYRYTLGDETAPIRPFAELMAGGSTNGFLSHQSLGAEFTASNTIDLDLLFEASELLPQNSAWLTKAGFAAGVSFRW